MDELTFSTIRKRGNETLLSQRKEQLKSISQKLTDILFPPYLKPLDVADISIRTIKASRNELLLPHNLEKVPLLISKKGKRFNNNLIRQGFISKSQSLSFIQEKNNKFYDIPCECIVESREDYIRGYNSANKVKKKAVLSWKHKKIVSMNYRIRFKRNNQDITDASDTAFYFNDLTECMKVMNFMKAIRALEYTPQNDEADFSLTLKKLSIEFRAQMARKFRVALNLRSDDLRKKALERKIEILKSSTLIGESDEAYMKLLVPKWIEEAYKINLLREAHEWKVKVLKFNSLIGRFDETIMKILVPRWRDKAYKIQVQLDTKRKVEILTWSPLIERFNEIVMKLLAPKWKAKSTKIWVLSEIFEKEKTEAKMVQSLAFRSPPSFELNRMLVSKQIKQKDIEIQKKLKANKNLSGQSIFIEIFKELAKNLNFQIVLTDQEPPKQLDFLRFLAKGKLSQKFVKVTFEASTQLDYEEIKKDKSKEIKISHEAIEYLCQSNMYQIADRSSLRVIALECNPKVSALILLRNCVPNEISKHIKVPEVSIIQAPDIPFLCLNVDLFDPAGDKSWGPDCKEKEMRGGLDYYIPKGWKGYGLKVLDKYGDDKRCLLDREKGWAVAYHGVRNDPAKIIKLILNTELRAGSGQAYIYSEDSNPLKPINRKVGEGVYFGQNIGISANGYSQTIQVNGKNYKFVLQCRLNPSEIRIPHDKPDYYVVPNGPHMRPYRILVKES